MDALQHTTADVLCPAIHSHSACVQLWAGYNYEALNCTTLFRVATENVQQTLTPTALFAVPAKERQRTTPTAM